MKIIIITGVSSGIGRACCIDCLEAGYEVIGTSRREGDVLDLSLHTHFHFVPCDMLLEESIEIASRAIRDICQEKKIYACIFNAGVAISGPQKYLPVQELKAQFQINVFAVMQWTKWVLPLMESNSRLIYMSSVSAMVTSPFVGAYAASKKAMEVLVDALRREIKGSGIHVCHLRPGPIATPIWDKAMTEDTSMYAGTEYASLMEEKEQRVLRMKALALPVEKVSKALLEILESSHPPLYRIVAKKPWLFHLLSRLPMRWLDFILTSDVRKLLGRP